MTKTLPMMVAMSQISPTKGVGTAEASYRRGFTHGVQCTIDALRSGHIGDRTLALPVLERILNVSVRMRFDNHPHGAFLDEVLKEVRP